MARHTISVPPATYAALSAIAKRRGGAVMWWIVPAPSLRSLSVIVLHACDEEPRWMVRR